jgi:hypothetical protein
MIIWRTDIENDEFKLRQLNDSDIERAESFFNVKLPYEYVSILKKQNGGYIIYNAHPSPVPTSWSDNSVSLDHIKGIGKGMGILNNAYLIKEWDLPEGIIVISGDGHSFIGFDYRITKNEPTVIYVDTQNNKEVTLASNFKEFLNNLYIEEIEVNETDLNIPSTSDLENALIKNDIENIIITLDTLPFHVDDKDLTWLLDKLILLSSHPHEEVRRSVAEATNSLTDFFTIENNVLVQLSEVFLNDENVDVQYFGSTIKDKLD